jgi:hypothetical protein
MRRLVALVLLSLSAACGGDEPSSATGPDTLAAKSIEAGEVTVKVHDVTIGAEGASFRITLDTHSVELDMDIAEGAELEVDGAKWTNARWDGDGPSGHHREGTLTFDPGGTAADSATLTLDGFPEPIRASWEL